MKGPLEGIRVLELAALGPAPYACALLGDLGADVVRVERPPLADGRGGGGEEIPPRFDFYNRNKRSLALDLKQPAALATVLQMVERADVLVEGYRPGVVERLGLGPEVCLQRNPRLVYGRMTGWGQDGPLAAGRRPRHQLPRAHRRALQHRRRASSRCRRSTWSPTSAAARCTSRWESSPPCSSRASPVRGRWSTPRWSTACPT